MIAKGRSVSFDMINGDEIDAPSSYAMLHDPTGKWWPKTSVLIAPFKRGGKSVDGDDFTKDYLGRTHVTRAGSVSLPPKALSEWKFEGTVEKIWYTRHGAKYGGQRFQHGFNQPGLTRLLKGKGKARLYSRGNVFRLELGRNASLDGRGFLWP